MSKTEPKKPDPQTWSEADLPILTDVEDGAAAEGVEIPDFDFSAELDQMAHTLTPSEIPLEFPSELLLDDVVFDQNASAEATLDFDQLPSLDLDAGTSASRESADSEFEFELEPVAAVAAPAVEAGADMADDSPLPDMQIPELTLDDVLTGQPAIEADSAESMAASAAIPELTLEDIMDGAADVGTPAEPAPVADEPVGDEPLAESSAPSAAIPELTLEDAVVGMAPADMAEATAEPAPPETEVPVLQEALPEMAQADMAEATAEPAPPETEVPVLQEALPEMAQADMAEATAEPAPPETEVPVLQETLPEMAQADMAEATAEPAPPETEVPVLDEQLLDVSADDVVGPAVLADAASVSAGDESLMLDDALDTAAMPVDLSLEASQAAEVEAALSAAQNGLETAAGELPAEGEPFRTIPLDSLPHGVLGGGRGIPEDDEKEASVQDLIRAAEITLAQERLKQVMAQAREEASQPLPAPALTALNEPASPAAAGVGAEPARPVEIINVAGLASSPAPQAFNLPPVRKSYVTLVDEAMLIDSLYDKILPRMKVELSLWLQDALDHQSKQMLSGVMHQLKEDYEMLFSETLRESLRQAIAEMGREDRGDRY
jgi:hypothetical protein